MLVGNVQMRIGGVGIYKQSQAACSIATLIDESLNIGNPNYLDCFFPTLIFNFSIYMFNTKYSQFIHIFIKFEQISLTENRR